MFRGWVGFHLFIFHVLSYKLSLCVYAYIYMYIYVYIYMCVCVHVMFVRECDGMQCDVCMHLHACMYACVYIYIYLNSVIK